MHTLTISRPAFLGLRRKRHTVHIPENYEELSSAQFRAVVLYSKGWITELAFFSMFFEIPVQDIPTLEPFVAYRLNQTLNFLAKLTPVSRLLIPHIYATVNRRRIRLTPPGPKLTSMTFQQFMTVDTFFAWYIYAENIQYLHNFIATLYTNPAVQFSQIDTETYRQAIISNPDNSRELMECIVVNWMLIKQWLANAYPKLFPGETAADEQQQHDKKKKTRPSSWLPIFDALVDEDFTRIESYQTLPAIDVIRIINRKIENQKKRK